MKHLKLLLSIFILLAYSQIKAQSCSAAFTYAYGVGSGEIIITDNSTNVTNAEFYSATATPQTSYLTQGSSTTVTFSANGTFNYVYLAYNTSTGSMDTIFGSHSIWNVACPPIQPVQWNTTNVPGQVIFQDSTLTGGSSAVLNFINSFPSQYNSIVTFPNGLGNGQSTDTLQVNANGTYYFYYIYNNGIVGCTDSILDSVVVNNVTGPCSIQQAGLTITPGSNPGEYVFTDNSTNAVYGNLSFWGGTTGNYQLTSTNPTVTHTFPYNGPFNYMYSIYNNALGCSDTLLGTILVNNLPPCNVTASLVVTNGSNPGQIILTDNSTNANAGAFLSFTGSPNVQSTAAGVTSVTYPNNGTYTYSFVAIDTNTNCGDTLYGTVTITNASPCNIQAGLTVTQGSNPNQYTFTDNSTNAFAGNLNFYIGSTASYTLIPNSATHTFTSNGTYAYAYIASDAVGCADTIYDTLVVTNVVPCNVTAGLTITQGSTPGQFTFTDNSTSATQGDLNIADGTFFNYQLIPSNPATHTFTANGTYFYYYYVNDGAGCSDSIIDTIMVSGIAPPPPPCNASFILLQDSLNTSQYYCWNTATNGAGTTTGLTYFWDFGDGNTSTLAYPVHTYNSLGTFTLCLTVSNAICTSTYCDTLVVSVKASGTTINVLPAGAGLGLEKEEIFQSIGLFPNPASGSTNLKIASSTDSQIRISVLSLSGQEIYAENKNISSGENQIQLDLIDLAHGVYMVSVIDTNSGSMKSLRMIKN